MGEPRLLKVLHREAQRHVQGRVRDVDAGAQIGQRHYGLDVPFARGEVHGGHLV